jgi:cyclase
MLSTRIIPRLDIKGPNLVKGIHLEGLRVLGKPEDFAKYYYESGADELYFQDIVASLYDRNSLQDIISRTANELFIPLTVGGGIRSIADIRNILKSGADKVAINTAAIKNPNIIQEAALKFGSSTIVVSIEAIRDLNGSYFAYYDNGREFSGIDVFEWALKVEALGAGELIITSVDNEGTGNGFDIELVKKLMELVSIPVIAHGGCGNEKHLLDLIQETSVDAVAISSILHYDFVSKFNFVHDSSSEGNTSFLNNKSTLSKINAATIQDLKNYLQSEGILIRN